MTTTVCTVPGCDGHTFSDGYCRSHHNRNHHYGHPLRIMRCEVVAGPLATPCLIVRKPKPATSGMGYVPLHFGGRLWRAHVWMWTIHHGPVPAGLVVRHACDTPPCVCIDHLVIGTQAENMADMVERGRHRGGGPSGEANGNATMTADTVRAMRRLHATGAWTYADLGRRFGCSEVQARNIVKRKSWRHVD